MKTTPTQPNVLPVAASVDAAAQAPAPVDAAAQAPAPVDAAAQAPAPVDAVAQAPAPDVQAETMKVLADLALRKHDHAEKQYDTLNTRIGVLFGFAGFVITAFREATKDVPEGWGKLILGLGYGLSFLYLAWQCKQAFSAANVVVLPKVDALFDLYAYGEASKLHRELTSELSEAFNLNDETYMRKIARFQKMTWTLFVQVVLIFVAAAWGLFEKNVSIPKLLGIPPMMYHP